MSNVYKDYKAPESQGLYHKFENGVTYTFRITSDPVSYISTYEGNGKVTERMIYAWLVWNIDESTVQILKLPKTGYQQIAKFGADDEYGDPLEYNIRITRTGEGLKTLYSIVASPKKTNLLDIAPEAFDALQEVDLIEAISKGNGVSNVRYLHDIAAEQAGGKTAQTTTVTATAARAKEESSTDDGW